MNKHLTDIGTAHKLPENLKDYHNNSFLNKYIKLHCLYIQKKIYDQNDLFKNDPNH